MWKKKMTLQLAINSNYLSSELGSWNGKIKIKNRILIYGAIPQKMQETSFENTAKLIHSYW